MIQRIAYTKYNHLSRMFKFLGTLHSISNASVSMWTSLLLLTIPTAGSDLLSISPSCWHLCCCLATPSAPLSPSFRQGGGFAPPHKHTLQEDYRLL